MIDIPKMNTAAKIAIAPTSVTLQWNVSEHTRVLVANVDDTYSKLVTQISGIA